MNTVAMRAINTPLNPSNPSIPSLAASDDPAIWASIYEADINLALWQRQQTAALKASVQSLLAQRTFSQLQLALPVASLAKRLDEELPDFELRASLVEDVAQLADMFACLFELNTVGLRLKVLDAAMCPRFHVDRVPCRLVSTYTGPTTEWLANKGIDRSKLGSGSNGLSDERSGLLRLGQQQPSEIQRMSTGEVGLLKGELWQGNEGRGLVHRSPSISGGKRLLLTLDFA